VDLKAYDYFLPKNNLALSPAVPRDSSKLFVYDTKSDKIIFDYFYNLDKYLPSNSFMVLNNTKVLPARVTMKKENGGKIVLLFLVNELKGSRVVKALVDRKTNIGDLIYFNPQNCLKVIRQNENIFELKFNFSQKHLFKLLNQYGTMPIPPYLKKTTLKRDELLEKYQTIFAKTDGSSAAPTASLHFTDSIFNKLNEKELKKLLVNY
jgi:S-adenosylmethionine:tRNA ribosyltransferase-isomerase